MKKYESLTIRVGPKAYQEIEVNGLDIKKIKTIMEAVNRDHYKLKDA